MEGLSSEQQLAWWYGDGNVRQVCMGFLQALQEFETAREELRNRASEEYNVLKIQLEGQIEELERTIEAAHQVGMLLAACTLLHHQYVHFTQNRQGNGQHNRCFADETVWGWRPEQALVQLECKCCRLKASRKASS